MRTPALCLVGAAAKLTFHVDLLPLGQILVAGVGQLAEGGAVKPLGLFPLLSGTVGVLPAAGYREAGHSLAVGCIAHLRVAPQVTYDDDLVHCYPLP